MKTVMKLLGFAAIAVCAVLFFAPKENLYYLLEKKMEPYGIIIGDEALEERGVGLHVDDATVYVREIESAGVKKTAILCLGLYNRVDVEGVRLAPAFEQFFPAKIEKMTFLYTIFDPLHLTAEAVGEFGTAEARLSLRDRLVKVVIAPSDLMMSGYANTLKTMSKDEAGGYFYESSF